MSRRPRYFVGAALAAAAVTVTAAACSAPGASSSNGSGTASTGASGAAAGPIKIAVVDAQSGADSDLGQFEWRGVKLRSARRTRPEVSTAARSS